MNCPECNRPLDLLPVIKGGMYYQAIGWGKKVCGTCEGLLTDEGGRWPDSEREQALAEGAPFGWQK